MKVDASEKYLIEDNFQIYKVNPYFFNNTKSQITQCILNLLIAITLKIFFNLFCSSFRHNAYVSKKQDIISKIKRLLSLCFIYVKHFFQWNFNCLYYIAKTNRILAFCYISLLFRSKYSEVG